MTQARTTQYICFLPALFFTWILAGQIIQLNLTSDKLRPYSGTISNIVEVATPRGKSSNNIHELRVFLKGNPDYFRLMDIYKYKQFSSALHIGDSAVIFIRPPWLVLLGMGKRNDIFQMTVNGNSIFKLSQTHRNSRGIIIVSVIAIPLFFFGLGTRRISLKQKAKTI